jgi:hypothetical protein
MRPVLVTLADIVIHEAFQMMFVEYEGQPAVTLLHCAGLHPDGGAAPACLKGIEWAQAQVDTIRLKLFKIGAIVKISVRRILLELSSAIPDLRKCLWGMSREY